jgi:hypothetical protein
MSSSLSLALLLGPLSVLMIGACGENREAPAPTQKSLLDLPKGVQHQPESALSPGLVLEPRSGLPHLLHVELELPEGQQLLRLRVLGEGPVFAELASKDMSQLDSLLIKESFEIPASIAQLTARHVLVIADYEKTSYGAGQALPSF